MRKLVAAFLALAGSISTAQAGQVWLTMDQVRPYTMKKPAQSIVIGNPGIADVLTQDGDKLMLVGKAPGLTNIYLFDESGETIENLMIRVRSASSDMLVVHRGAARTTYNCTINCEATITVGDTSESFNGVSQQVTEKFGQAQQAAGGGNN